MKYLFWIIIFLMLSQHNASAQRQNYIVVFGKVKVEWGNLEDTRIVLYENGKKIATNKLGSNGKFTFDLELNKDYMFWFQKTAYVTKKINFNTNVPSQVTESIDFIPFEDFDFNVSLFKTYPEVDTMFFENPVGKIKYYDEINGFDYDKDYTLTILNQMEAIEDKIREKHKNEEDRVKKEQKENEKAEELAAKEKEKMERDNADKLAAIEKQKREKEKAEELAATEKENIEKENDRKRKEELALNKDLEDDNEVKATETPEVLPNKTKNLDNAENKGNELASLKEIKDDGLNEKSETERRNIEYMVDEDKVKAKPEVKSVNRKIDQSTSNPIQSNESKTTTRTIIQRNGMDLVLIKVSYYWGGEFYFIQYDNRQYQNISKNYYYILMKNKSEN